MNRAVAPGPEPREVLRLPRCEVDEDEGCREPGEPDVVNGGCDAELPAFTDVYCGAIVCGTTWKIGGASDSEWYRVPVSESQYLVEMSLDLSAEFDARRVFAGVDPQREDSSPASIPSPGQEDLHYAGLVPSGSEAWWVVAPRRL